VNIQLLPVGIREMMDVGTEIPTDLVVISPIQAILLPVDMFNAKVITTAIQNASWVTMFVA
jgi:hypothetical protein